MNLLTRNFPEFVVNFVSYKIDIKKTVLKTIRVKNNPC